MPRLGYDHFHLNSFKLFIHQSYYNSTLYSLDERFSNGAPQEVARCAANIIKVYFKNENKPICTEIFIHSLKYINIF
jgi:hypothetical protein